MLNLFLACWALILLGICWALARWSVQRLFSPALLFFLSFFSTGWAFIVFSGNWALARRSTQ